MPPKTSGILFRPQSVQYNNVNQLQKGVMSLGGHYLDYQPSTLRYCQVITTHQENGYTQIKSMGTRSSNELWWLHLSIGNQKSIHCKGLQGDMPYSRLVGCSYKSLLFSSGWGLNFIVNKSSLPHVTTSLHHENCCSCPGVKQMITKTSAITIRTLPSPRYPMIYIMQCTYYITTMIINNVVEGLRDGRPTSFFVTGGFAYWQL